MANLGSGLHFNGMATGRFLNERAEDDARGKKKSQQKQKAPLGRSVCASSGYKNYQDLLLLPSIMQKLKDSRPQQASANPVITRRRQNQGYSGYTKKPGTEVLFDSSVYQKRLMRGSERKVKAGNGDKAVMKAGARLSKVLKKMMKRNGPPMAAAGTKRGVAVGVKQLIFVPVVDE